MGIAKVRFILVLLVIQCTFAVCPVRAAFANHDLTAIKNLLLTFERGYEERNVEKYMSVFSDETFEYISDMATPDDPSDDIRFTKTEEERRSAIKVFSNYENFDMELTELKYIIHNGSAEVKAQIKIVIVVFEGHVYPEIYYAVTSNTFLLRKFNGQWKIVKWQQSEMPADKLVLRSQEEIKDKSVDDLIQDLGDARMVKWAIAISDLKRVRDMAMDSLIKVLHNPNKNLRLRIAWVLAGTSDGNAVQNLIGVLKDNREDVDVRVAVANALSRCDSQMVDSALFMAARNSVPEVKAAASLALARRIRGKADELYQVVAAETRGKDETARQAAVESMGIIMSLQGTEFLERIFEDENESESIRMTAIESLKQMRSESALLLFRDALKDKDESVKIRAAAARALGEAKDNKSLEVLMDIAKNEKEVVELRKAAIAGLGMVGNPKATKLLIDFLVSPDSTLRYEAVKSLEILEDRYALRHLMMVLMNSDENDSIRRLAGRGVVKIDLDIAFGPLVQILKDETESAPARRMAAEELAASGNTQSISVFAGLLEDKRHPWWIKLVAVNCLVRMVPYDINRCAEALKVAINDPDDRVAKAARDALEKINKPLVNRGKKTG